MSRVTYTNIADSADQEQLRMAHGVRLIRDDEEGTGVNALPGGVYGFTYSPGLPNAPLFTMKRYRSYEIHKLATGETFVIAFADPDAARQIASVAGDATVRVQPDSLQAAAVLVEIPYSRIRHHRQYAAPNQEGLTVTLGQVESSK
ncbi:MAG: hypothetical protein ACRD3C_15380 [Vicinamibacterales bacterium]